MSQSRTRALLTAPMRGVKALTQMRFGGNGGGLFGMFMPNSRIDYSRMVGDGTRSSVVMAATRWLQRNFAQAPLTVLKPAGDGALTPVIRSEQGAGRMLTLIDMPNPYYHGGALWKATVLSYVLDGNAYWIKIRNSVGAPVQLWWHPHTLIRPMREFDSGNFIDYYEVDMGSGVPERLAPSEVVHFRDGIDPDDQTKGMSAMRSLLREVFTDDEAANYTAALLKNMGVPGIILSPDASAISSGQHIPDGNLQETKEKLEQLTTGDNRGRGMVMRGATKVSTVGFNPQEMNLRDVRKIPEERITANIGVPAVVCGLGAGLDRSTFANMSEAREAAGEEALVPMYDDFAPTLQHQLLGDFEGDRAKILMVSFDTTQMRILREDEDKTATRWTATVGGGIATVKEAREAMGLPVDESHEIYLRPLMLIEVPAHPQAEDEKPPADRTLEYRLAAAVDSGLITLNEAREQLGKPPVAEGNELRTPAEPVVKDRPDSGQKLKALGIPYAVVKSLTNAQRAKLITSLDRDARAMETPFVKRLEPLFKGLADDVVAAYRSTTKGRKADSVDVAKILKLAGVAKWKKDKLGGAYTAQYQAVATQTLKTLSASIGLELGDRVDEVAVRVLREGGKNIALVNIEAQTRSAILDALAEGKESGMGPKDLERLIRANVEGGPSKSVSVRATRIARTETMNAQRISTRTAYQVSGAYTDMVAFDDRLGYGDDDCVARNGETFSFDQADAEEADEHPNGTLSWAPGTAAE